MGGGALFETVDLEIKKQCEIYKQGNNKYKKFIIIFDLKKYIEAFKISEHLASSMFKDARFLYRIYENWAGKIYGFEQSENTNDKKDGFLKLPGNLPNLNIGVRCLTKSGLGFIQNQFVGRGKGWEWRPLFILLNVGNCSFQVICDIIDSPKVYYTLISSNDVLYYSICEEIKSFKRDTYYKTFFGKTLDELEKENLFELIDIYK